MSTAAYSAPFGATKEFVRGQGFVLAAFTATLFLSAVMLFSVQPLFARMVLPTLGGTPAVWAISLCFFQAALLVGYAYAHALNRYASAQSAPLIHIALLAAAALTLPFGLPSDLTPPVGDAYVWLLGVLAVGVGLPFLAVSASAPLLQAWYARTGHPHARDPYFLYGASNLGSLIALLAYPVVVEPLFGLSKQATIWTGGFLLLGFAIALCGYLMVMFAGKNQVTEIAATADADGEQAASSTTADASRPITWRQQALWVLYAFVPSGLLVAFTNFVTTDIASAPFLWVTPLAVFLLTFVLVFREKPLVPFRFLLAAQPVFLALVMFSFASVQPNSWLTLVVAHSPLFLVTTLVAHKQLYDTRPSAEHLTQFYLWMSFGGVLGGIFAAIVAPQVFNNIYEYPLLVLFGMACRPDVAKAIAERTGVKRAVRTTAIAAAVIASLMVLTSAFNFPLEKYVAHFILVGAAAMLFSVKMDALWKLVFSAVMVAAILVLPSRLNTGDAERNFFGVIRVAPSPDGKLSLLLHGTTVHGATRLDDIGLPAGELPRPLTYYYPGSPMQMGTEAARIATGKTGGGLNVGAVGLGAGSLACAAKANETWRFYEIDPMIVRIARDPKYFSFLSRCMPDNDIVLGDARLTVSREPNGKFDYLVLDAFSSDTVPVHLITKEALAGFLDKLSPDGLLALHVSNRYMDLENVAIATALAVPGAHVAYVDGRPEHVSYESSLSSVLFIAKNQASLAPVLAWPRAKSMESSKLTPWTDDYSNIIAAIWRKARGEGRIRE
ncbi:MAG: fused MFS/spermidine synthase [Hyphomicrobiaceae bacterium]|nr:fused MFS/spermidine synthase [Hyphomicrobiaceae bacterium]